MKVLFQNTKIHPAFCNVLELLTIFVQEVASSDIMMFTGQKSDFLSIPKWKICKELIHFHENVTDVKWSELRPTGVLLHTQPACR